MKPTAKATELQDPIKEYLDSVRNMSTSTAYQYKFRLENFRRFAETEFNLSIDKLILRLEEGVVDVYHVFSKYLTHLCSTANGHTLSPSTIKTRINTARGFLESQSEVEISERKFRLRVKVPKSINKKKDALSKTDVIDIINSCSDIRLRTYVHLLAATGMRATEALSTRICDYELDSVHPTVAINGENTKTKTDRKVLLTKEVVQQIRLWIEYKHRTRRISFYRGVDNKEQPKKTVSKYVTPERNDENLLFAIRKGNIKPVNLYTDMVLDFEHTLDRIGRGSRENHNPRARRKITLHSFRRYVKTTISDLGYSDYSEYFIGHSGSTYYTKSEKDIVKMFEKIEPYLTFLDYEELDRKGADIQSKIDELEELNQSLRERDRTKDDAIAQLSDQLMTLTVRLQEIERKQNNY